MGKVPVLPSNHINFFIFSEYRGNNGSVNIIVNFGWAGLAGQLILFPVELKAPNRGTVRQSKQAPRAMRFL